MPRKPDAAPPGYFTLADAARITGIDRRRINYWCSLWGAGLIDPTVDPCTRGGSKFLSEHDLVKVAVIPIVLKAGLRHADIAKMFSKAEAGWWDLSKAKRDNPNFLDWIVVVRDWRFRPKCYFVASAYKYGPSIQVGHGPLDGLQTALNDALWKDGVMRGFQVIELSNIKRELLERIARGRHQGS